MPAKFSHLIVFILSCSGIWTFAETRPNYKILRTFQYSGSCAVEANSDGGAVVVLSRKEEEFKSTRSVTESHQRMSAFETSIQSEAVFFSPDFGREEHVPLLNRKTFQERTESESQDIAVYRPTPPSISLQENGDILVKTAEEIFLLGAEGVLLTSGAELKTKISAASTDLGLNYADLNKVPLEAEPGRAQSDVIPFSIVAGPLRSQSGTMAAVVDNTGKLDLFAMNNRQRVSKVLQIMRPAVNQKRGNVMRPVNEDSAQLYPWREDGFVVLVSPVVGTPTTRRNYRAHFVNARAEVIRSANFTNVSRVLVLGDTLAAQLDDGMIKIVELGADDALRSTEIRLPHSEYSELVNLLPKQRLAVKVGKNALQFIEYAAPVPR